jgi:hypothetical protein
VLLIEVLVPLPQATNMTGCQARFIWVRHCLPISRSTGPLSAGVSFPLLDVWMDGRWRGIAHLWCCGWCSGAPAEQPVYMQHSSACLRASLLVSTQAQSGPSGTAQVSLAHRLCSQLPWPLAFPSDTQASLSLSALIIVYGCHNCSAVVRTEGCCDR